MSVSRLKFLIKKERSSYIESRYEDNTPQIAQAKLARMRAW